MRDHIAPLIRGNAASAAKLDLVLRGLAERDRGTTNLPIGALAPDISWSALHDLIRPTFDGEKAAAKSKFVNKQLGLLEDLRLIERREPVAGRRPLIVVLADDGSRRPLDDPNGTNGNSYLTILRGVISSGALATWDGPTVAAYLAATIAERYARADDGLSTAWGLPGRPIGSGMWMRSLDWFADTHNRRPQEHIRVPFSERTLRRGLHRLRQDRLIETYRTRRDPRKDRPFEGGPRTVYTNNFAWLQGLRNGSWHRTRPDTDDGTTL